MDENNEVLVAVREVVKKVDDGFARVDQRFARVDQQFEELRKEFHDELDEKIRETHVLIEGLRSDMAAIGEGVSNANEKLDAPQGLPVEVRVSALEVRVTRLEKKRRN
jgi:archaellum component FlaC